MWKFRLFGSFVISFCILGCECDARVRGAHSHPLAVLSVYGRFAAHKKDPEI
jgi:hypothetical protein